MATNLMTPRYKVIADYPDSKLPIGSILTTDKDGGDGDFKVSAGPYSHIHFEYPLEKYPAVFSPIPWWVGRAESDMPEYVKNREGVVVKVKRWLWNEQEKCFLFRCGYTNVGFEPATEKEHSEWKAYRQSMREMEDELGKYSGNF